MTSRRRLPAVVTIAVTALLAMTALAMSPQPVPLSYPALDGMCFLQAEAAADGVEGAYPIGSTVRTKFGRWTCTKIVARQSPVVTAGVWVQQ